MAPAAAELGRSAAEARSHSPPVVVEEPHDPRDADPDWLGEDDDRAAVRPRGALRVRLIDMILGALALARSRRTG